MNCWLCEVDMETGMTSEPPLHLRMLVRSVVVDDQVKIFFRRSDLINHAQELEPFLMTVPVIAHADDRTVKGIHGGEQRGGAIPFVVVGHGAAAAFFDR